jgi:hypothetical protein
MLLLSMLLLSLGLWWWGGTRNRHKDNCRTNWNNSTSTKRKFNINNISAEGKEHTEHDRIN